MRGTFPYCRTGEALKRMEDGDIIQNLRTEQYFKKEAQTVYASTDSFKWGEFAPGMNIFSSDEEWRSLSNLHYYNDLKKEAGEQKIWFLTRDNEVIDETSPLANKNKKRWFYGSILE